LRIIDVNFFVISFFNVARQKLKKLEQTNEQAETNQQYGQAELRMRKTQQV
jgi:hypothetical protein